VRTGLDQRREDVDISHCSLGLLVSKGRSSRQQGMVLMMFVGYWWVLRIGYRAACWLVLAVPFLGATNWPCMQQGASQVALQARCPLSWMHTQHTNHVRGGRCSVTVDQIGCQRVQSSLCTQSSSNADLVCTLLCYCASTPSPHVRAAQLQPSSSRMTTKSSQPRNAAPGIIVSSCVVGPAVTKGIW
jgi:hypothetical protein